MATPKKNKIKWYRKILPYVMSKITGKTRYLPDIEWSSKSWVHNIFRFYELVFWRRYGIRAEVSAALIDGTVVYQFHSWEAVFAHVETTLRRFRFPRIVKVYVPQLAPVGGYSLPSRSPYLFAIAFDASRVEADNGGGTGDISFSFTTTGSDRLLWAYVWSPNLTGTQTSSYAAVAMTKTANSPFDANSNRYDMFYLAAPTSGANTWLGINDGSYLIIGSCISYSGCRQTSIPDASDTSTTASGTSLTSTVTTVADNCWTVLFAHSTTDIISAGTGSTARAPAANAFDSNAAITPAGAYSMETTLAASGTQSHMMFSFAPPSVTTFNAINLGHFA